MQFLTENSGLIGTVILIVGCLNIGLAALSSILDKIQDKTETTADNKFNEYLKKGLAVLKTVLDWVSSNRAH